MPPVRFEGHYRSLERRLLGIVAELRREPGDVCLVAAGRPQMERVAGLLAVEAGGILTGVRLFPGFPQFAAWARGLPFEIEKPDPFDTCAFAMEAMRDLSDGDPFSNLRGNARTAQSLADFFERLLDRGIDSTAYIVSSGSTSSGPTPTEAVVGRLFRRYEELRESRYPRTADAAVTGLTESNCREPGPLLIYGFYDLTPGQRRLVRVLHRAGWRLSFFDPVPASSHWATDGRLGARTHSLLEELGCDSAARSDSEVEMGPFCELAESALSRTAKPRVENLVLMESSGALGTARAVLQAVRWLVRDRGLDPRSIAVVEKSGSEVSAVARLAWHEGTPVCAPLEVPMISLPGCRLVLSILEAIGNDLHYTLLRRAALTGCLAEGCDPAPSEIERAVGKTGVRAGEEAWLSAGPELSRNGAYDALAALVRGMAELRAALPARETPAGYMTILRERLLPMVLPDAVPDEAVSPESILSDEVVGFGEFASMLEAVYGVRRFRMRKADRDGFRILTPEQIRGSLFDAVIVTGLEEGVFPASYSEDARLTAELRRALQLSLPEERLFEERFLFRQVLESASRFVFLVHRNRGPDGRPEYPSVFVEMLRDRVTSAGPGEGSRPVRPSMILLDGDHPGQVAARAAMQGELPVDVPFLAEALEAERARLGGGPFDRYDGVLGEGLTGPGPRGLSASKLESYARCPFACLVEKVWRLEERPRLSVSSEPDARLRGIVLHDAVESILIEHGTDATPDQVRRILERVALDGNLLAAMGSPGLLELFLDRWCDAVTGFLRTVSSRLEGRFGHRELDLDGTLGETRVHGRLDLVVQRGERGSLVLDLKSGKPFSKSKALSRTIEGAWFQLPVYYALALQNGLSPSGAGYLHISGELDEDDLPVFEDPGDLGRMVEAASSRAGACSELMSLGFFPPVPREEGICRNCWLSDLCRRTPQSRITSKMSAEDPLLRRLLGEEDPGGD